MIKQEIFNDQAIELANFVLDNNREWKDFEEYLKAGGNPFEHICFSACVILDLVEEDFLETVSEYSTEEFIKMVEDFIENEMGE